MSDRQVQEKNKLILCRQCTRVEKLKLCGLCGDVVLLLLTEMHSLQVDSMGLLTLSGYASPEMLRLGSRGFRRFRKG